MLNPSQIRFYYFARARSARWNDPTKKQHKFSDEGSVYIDAIDGRILNEGGITSSIKKLFSSEEKVSSSLINELKYVKDATSYKIFPDPYQVIVNEPDIQDRFARKLAVDWIIDKNTKTIRYQPKSSESIFDMKSVTFTPRRKQVMIKKVSFLYVPKWSVTFLSQGIDYNREVYAFSGTTIEDTLEYCPKHLQIGALKFRSKKTVAVCDICGQALCEEHLGECPVCGKWVCGECGVQCEVCGQTFCNGHISDTCSICGQALCENCVQYCPICGSIYGIKHQIKCENCGTNVCENCSESKGWIRKKHYCKNCIDII